MLTPINALLAESHSRSASRARSYDVAPTGERRSDSSRALGCEGSPPLHARAWLEARCRSSSRDAARSR
eukprot:2727311-Prymnesium_polylepis.1